MDAKEGGALDEWMDVNGFETGSNEKQSHEMERWAGKASWLV